MEGGGVAQETAVVLRKLSELRISRGRRVSALSKAAAAE